MGYALIITEKPSQALKIATALADKSPKKVNEKGGVYYFDLTHNGKRVIVSCAAGHLFSVAEKEKSFKYPSYDIDWVPSYRDNKGAAFTKKYADTIKKLAKDASEFVVACDFDIEGEVIGLNILRFLCNQKDANRMKFSTLTKNELIKAFDTKQDHLEWGQAKAGETRHFLDWLYGINLSRAMMLAVKKAGSFKVLSIGRVQSPALKIIVDKEKEIRAFVPVPYWQLQLLSDKNSIMIESWHKDDKIFEKEKAEEINNKCKGRDGDVVEIKTSESKQQPPTPFDLGSLQTEAHKLFGYKPKRTLEIAQALYLDGVASYPRTSSQKLPTELGLKNILEKLKKMKKYEALAGKVLSFKKLKPHEGKKTDPAHPAIHPTGESPGNPLNDQEIKIYDLIVKRFLATFGEPAKRETMTATIEIEKEPFIAKGTRTIFKGWHELYDPYVRLKEVELPELKKGETLKTKELNLLEKETQPPKRYTQSSIVNELEKRGLGTKATRADIVDNLFKRGYVIGENNIEATELGIKTIDVIENHVKDIVDEELTRQFEEEMEKIREENKTPEQILEKAKSTLTKILETFKKDEQAIGEKLLQSYRESLEAENTLGKCPKCDGNLMIKRSKFGRFIGCNKYPDCKYTLKIPQGGRIKCTEDLCEECKMPIIIIGSGKRQQKVCVNPDCSTKRIGENAAEQEKIEKEAAGRKCPKCGKDLVIRKSVYGEFLGCSGFPKCKHTEALNGNNGKNNNTKKES